MDLRLRCKGKYIIALEGDDYWIDDRKLEKEISFLETHPDYIAVAHNCQIVDENNHLLNEEYPECKDNEYTFYHYLLDIMPGQFTTVMMRNPYTQQSFDTSLIDEGLVPGDKAIYFSLLTAGKIYCIQNKMSAYRHVTNKGSSYSATYNFNYYSKKHFYDCISRYALQSKNLDAVIVAKVQMIVLLRTAFRKKSISLKTFLVELLNVRCSLKVLKYLILRDIKIKR